MWKLQQHNYWHIQSKMRWEYGKPQWMLAVSVASSLWLPWYSTFLNCIQCSPLSASCPSCSISKIELGPELSSLHVFSFNARPPPPVSSHCVDSVIQPTTSGARLSSQSLLPTLYFLFCLYLPVTHVTDLKVVRFPWNNCQISLILALLLIC